MPRKPKKPCAYPGCPELTDGRYCERHRAQVGRKYERYDRDPETRRRYGRNWQMIRSRYVRCHPFCEICMENGRLTPVEEVHHKIPLRDGGTHDPRNLISLCKPCHSRIHARRGDRWKREGKE